MEIADPRHVRFKLKRPWPDFLIYMRVRPALAGCCSTHGELAEELRRTPGLALKPAVVQGVFFLYFPTNRTRNHPGMTSA